MTDATSARTLLRHVLTTLAYRGGKAVRGAPDSFAGYRCGESSRTPLEILAHVGDLFDWTASLCDGRHVWNEATPRGWEAEVERFFAGLASLDAILASKEPLGYPEERIFQGPLADALTHVGQLTMLRRMAGSPVRAENYFKAAIETGHVGSDQPAPVYEFDRPPVGGTPGAAQEDWEGGSEREPSRRPQ